ncbi:hypothetical protein PoB_000987600 [Plakobranchus ocellatus]|uniref:Secreted protein n=1 Tax=Plakobranchus ocellatus TaxID=259542 RepID=A0AAV3YJE3_9GAST|nr:hypothetical protein PoB_000987600 [Plakobranchus ocellatus]
MLVVAPLKAQTAALSVRCHLRRWRTAYPQQDDLRLSLFSVLVRSGRRLRGLNLQQEDLCRSQDSLAIHHATNAPLRESEMTRPTTRTKRNKEEPA